MFPGQSCIVMVTKYITYETCNFESYKKRQLSDGKLWYCFLYLLETKDGDTRSHEG